MRPRNTIVKSYFVHKQIFCVVCPEAHVFLERKPRFNLNIAELWKAFYFEINWNDDKEKANSILRPVINP